MKKIILALLLIGVFSTVKAQSIGWSTQNVINILSTNHNTYKIHYLAGGERYIYAEDNTTKAIYQFTENDYCYRIFFAPKPGYVNYTYELLYSRYPVYRGNSEYRYVQDLSTDYVILSSYEYTNNQAVITIGVYKK